MEEEKKIIGWRIISNENDILTREDIEGYLKEIFEKGEARRKLHQDLAGRVDIFEDENTLCFTIGGKLSTGIGGFKRYLEVGGGVIEMYYNGTKLEEEDIQKVIEKTKTYEHKEITK